MEGLLELLEAALGFIAVMLLLSLLVTAFTQFVKATFRTKGKHLEVGLTELFATIGAGSPAEPQPPSPDLERAKQLAREVCRSPLLMPVTGTLFGKLRDRARPVRTRIELDELKEVLNAIGAEERSGNAATKDAAAGSTEKSPDTIVGLAAKVAKGNLDVLFPRLERAMDKRFEFWMRVFSVTGALIAAFVFQVSAPRLLRDLSTDPVLRARYVAAAEGMLDTVDPRLTRLGGYDAVADGALERLQEMHPDLAEVLEEASGSDRTKAGVLEELDLVLEGRPDREQVLRDYESLLDELYADQARVAFEELSRATGELASLDITPWRYGWRFYSDASGVRWANWLGVLVTAVLLTFGAPFWYSRLKDVANLRDALKPKPQGGDGQGEKK